MEAVKLKLNEAKTKFIYFGSRQQLSKAIHTTIKVIGELIKRSTKVQYLGGHLDSNLTIKHHIHTKCKAATLNIIKICNIRKYLMRETCHKLILLLVISHLDYANSMLAGLLSSSIKIMQKVQRTIMETVQWIDNLPPAGYLLIYLKSRSNITLDPLLPKPGSAMSIQPF